VELARCGPRDHRVTPIQVIETVPMEWATSSAASSTTCITSARSPSCANVWMCGLTLGLDRASHRHGLAGWGCRRNTLAIDSIHILNRYPMVKSSRRRVVPRHLDPGPSRRDGPRFPHARRLIRRLPSFRELEKCPYFVGSVTSEHGSVDA